MALLAHRDVERPHGLPPGVGARFVRGHVGHGVWVQADIMLYWPESRWLSPAMPKQCKQHQQVNRFFSCSPVCSRRGVDSQGKDLQEMFDPGNTGLPWAACRLGADSCSRKGQTILSSSVCLLRLSVCLSVVRSVCCSVRMSASDGACRLNLYYIHEPDATFIDFEIINA